jgi:nicotinamide riboside kinase
VSRPAALPIRRGFVVALLGAESTGKTTLAEAMAQALAAEGHSVANVAEYLREFCVAVGRTPRREEQAAIAAEQTRRIAEAAASHDVVIADTTALMVAIYSDYVFADTALYEAALADHAEADLTLLTALDLEWQPDDLCREGPHVQPPIDALLRAALARGGIGYTVVSGSGPARLDSAMKSLRHAMGRSSAGDEQAANPPWRWVCDRCGDADCERRLLPHLRDD